MNINTIKFINGRYLFLLGLFFLIHNVSADYESVSSELAKEKGCLSCHEGIEQFTDGPMMDVIKALGSSYGDPGGCVICHGGTPNATNKNTAHVDAPKALKNGNGPELFYPDPGSIWIVNRTCGQCHQGYQDRLKKALMSTEAGKLQGNLWSWAMHNENKHKVVWGNHDVKDTDGPTPIAGTATYKKYMTAFAKAHRRLKVMACTSSIGPGATNMITGAATATVNRLPVLLLPGDVFASRRPDPVLQQLESSQSMDISVNDCFKPVSRYWDRISRPEQLLQALPEAMRVLTSPSETGAVTLCLPQDVQAEAFDYPENFFNKKIF